MPYYQYDAGSLLSFNGTGIKTVGFNQWDEETRTDGFFNNTGAWASGATVSSKNPIPVLPNTTYYLAEVNGNVPIYVTQWTKPVPSGTSASQYFIKRDNVANGGFITDPNCYAIHFNCGSAYGTTYNHDICINISDVSKNGTYEPYTSSTLDIPVSTYFPTGMKSAGTVYDEFVSSRAYTRIGEVDLGSLTWERVQGTSAYYFRASVNLIPNLLNMVCAIYQVVVGSQVSSADKQIGVNGSGVYMYVRDDSYTSESDFKTAMDGVMLQYELAEEIVEPTLDFGE